MRYEERGAAEFKPFADAVDRYVKRYFEHIRKEEREVMPLARRVLSEQDWADIEEAFARHRDPLAGVPPDATYDQLFSRIVQTVPAPYGVGAPLED